MSSKISINYFPFAPGIPWGVKKGRYVVPKLDKGSWDRAHEGRSAAFVSYGGLIEAMTSLLIIEHVHKLRPSMPLYYVDNAFKELGYLQGLVGYQNETPLIDDKNIGKYPLPIFLDKDKFVYYNCLFNYLDVYTINGDFGYIDKRPIIKQIFENSCLEYTKANIKFRNLTMPPEFEKLKISKKFDFNKSFILLVPDKTGMSIHGGDYLGWSAQDVRSFTSMVAPTGINVIILTNEPFKYHGMKALILDMKLSYICWCVKNAYAIISNDIDILLSSLLISSGKVIAPRNKKELSIKSNYRFLEPDVDLRIIEKLSPFNIFMEIK